MKCPAVSMYGHHLYVPFIDIGRACQWCREPMPTARPMEAGDIIPSWVWEPSCSTCPCDDCRPLWPFVTQFSVS